MQYFFDMYLVHIENFQVYLIFFMMEQLCSQDRAILNSLFNPLLPLGEAVVDDVNVDQPQGK